MISICPITGDVNFDELIKVLSAKFLQCKVAIFPFVIKKYLEGDYINTQFFIMCLPTKFIICWWFLPEAVITVVCDKWWWSNSIIPSVLLVGILLEEKLFLIPHLFTYSFKIFISVWTLGCFVHSMNKNSLILLLILLFKWSQYWRWGAPSRWLHPFNMSHQFLNMYLISGITLAQEHFVLPWYSPEMNYFSKEPSQRRTL